MKHIITIAITLITTTSYARTEFLQCKARNGTTVVNLTTAQAQINLLCWELGCAGYGQLESKKINEDGSTTYFLNMVMDGNDLQKEVRLNVKQNGDSVISIKDQKMKCEIIIID